MVRPIQSAVAAVAVGSLERQLIYVLAASGVALEYLAHDGASALNAAAQLRPELLIADAELPVADGALLARRALSCALPVRPAVLLLKYAGFALPEEDALEAAGACILEKPFSEAGFSAALQRLEARWPVFLPDECRRADELLSSLGFPAHAGRECLKCAALLCVEDERFLKRRGERLYPAVGEICGMDAARAERAIRHAIGLAWQSDKIENQYRIFADAIDAGRGQPTCGEMIARLADILRLEG